VTGFSQFSFQGAIKSDGKGKDNQDPRESFSEVAAKVFPDSGHQASVVYSQETFNLRDAEQRRGIIRGTLSRQSTITSVPEDERSIRHFERDLSCGVLRDGAAFFHGSNESKISLTFLSSPPRDVHSHCAGEIGPCFFFFFSSFLSRKERGGAHLSLST
jgi:hypothetical protein